MITNFTLAAVGKRAVFFLTSGTWKFLLLLTTCNIQCIVAGWFSSGTCWCPSGWVPVWRLHTKLYKFGQNIPPDLSCIYRIFLWPKSWRGSLHIYPVSFPRFRTLSIERFWFLFWSILNDVTLKTWVRNSPFEQLQPVSVISCHLVHRLANL